MKVLILGSGGREHALAWKLSKRSEVSEVVVIPGNPGMKMTPKVQSFNSDWKNRKSFVEDVKKINPEYIIIGPEDPLANGVADFLREEGFSVVGPSAKAAKLESSKAFAKDFMSKYEIPTADYKVISNLGDGLNYLDNIDIEKGIVVKANALAGGKGVVVTKNLAEAKDSVYDFLENKNCSVSTDKIVFEKMLVGKELSAFALCDGKNYVTLGYACDYKRIKDNDIGPNTGGMGGYSPQNWPSKEVKKKIDSVFSKTLAGMEAEGTPFQGFLFVGLMISGEDINVIEYNVRMGDPETQILMPILDDRFCDSLQAAANGTLKGNLDISEASKTCVHIVLTSEGYPSIDESPLNLGQAITFPSELVDSNDNDIQLFFAGVKEKDQKLVNSGGRVLGLSVVGKTVEEARDTAYEKIRQFNFKGMHYRKDIAKI